MFTIIFRVMQNYLYSAIMNAWEINKDFFI